MEVRQDHPSNAETPLKLLRQSSVIPREFSTRVGGTGEWALFWRILLPVSEPVTAVLGILVFTISWNDYIWPLVVLMQSNLFTVSLGLPTLIGSYSQQYVAVMAGSSPSTIPIVAVFLFTQRQLRRVHNGRSS